MSDADVNAAIDRIARDLHWTLKVKIVEQLEHFKRFIENLKTIQKNRGPFSQPDKHFGNSLLMASQFITRLRETIKINREEHQQYLGEVDKELQTLSTEGLSLLANIIHTDPVAAIDLGYENISRISSCLIGHCSNKDNPELQEAIGALDSALLSVDTRALSIHRILEFTESLKATDISLAFATAGSGEPKFMVMKENLQGWIDARNLGGQTTLAAKGPDPALGG